jgi:PAS domain S-box-containing protein
MLMTKRAPEQRPTVIRDIVVVIAFVVVCVVLGILFDVFDVLHRITRIWEDHEIDEIIFILPLALAIGMLWFSWRRLKDYRRELTERKAVEDALRESEDLYRTLVNTSPDGIMMTDIAGNILMANTVALTDFGYADLKDMLANVKNVMGLYAFEEAPRLLEHTISAVQKGDLKKYEYAMKRKDGSVFPGELSLAVFWDHDGNPKGLIGVGRDITDRRRVERELTRHRENLEELVQERTAQLEAANRELELEIGERRRVEAERENLIAELQKALLRVKTLSGLIPICSSCKKIRDDEGYWHKLEEYLNDHSEAEFSHGLCPDCLARLYPEEYQMMVEENPEMLLKK